MDNTGVSTSNTTVMTTPTTSLVNSSSSNYKYSWSFTMNVDYYEKYRIKHVKLGNTMVYTYAAYQNCANVPEIEFF